MTDDKDKRHCPECNKPIQAYHSFCPHCDAEFNIESSQPTDNGNATQNKQVLSQQAENEKTCYSCGKRIEDHHEFCPWCDVDITGNGAEEPIEEMDTAISPSQPQQINPANYKKEDNESPSAEPTELYSMSNTSMQEAQSQQMTIQTDSLAYQVCGECGNQLKPEYSFCNVCGQACFPQGTRSQMSPAASIDIPFAPPAVQMDPSHVARYSPENYHTGQTGVAENQSALFNCQTPIPFIVHFLSGKTYKQNQSEILEFRIINQSNYPVNDLEFSVNTKLTSQQHLVATLPFTLTPSVSTPINISGFLPNKSGSDVVKIKIKSSIMGRCDLYLVSEAILQVKTENDDSKPNINVNISSGGPLIVDMEDALADLEKRKLEIDEQQNLQWTEIPVYWNEKKMESEARYFPAACVTPQIFNFSASDFLQSHMISGMDAPRAVISDESGGVTYLIAGNNLSLGRDPKINHITSVSQPFADHKGKNAKISRQHCRIFIKNNSVFIHDLSSHGVFLNKSRSRIPKNTDIKLKNDDVFSIANVLFMQLKIYTDGQDIININIDRQHNKTNERYFLNCKYLPLGTYPGLPIVTQKTEEIAGAFFYHSMQRVWCYRKLDNMSLTGDDLTIKRYQEFIFGNTKYWFSIL